MFDNSDIFSIFLIYNCKPFTVGVFRVDIPGLGYSSYLLKYTPSSPHLLRSRIVNNDITIVTDVSEIFSKYFTFRVTSLSENVMKLN